MFNAGSPRSLRYLLPYFCSLLLLSAGLNAQAQFSGPALSAPAQGNSVQTPTTDLALLNPAAGEVTIVPGDVLSIRLFGSATYAPTVVVGSDGTVDLPLIGQVPVGGLTSTQASKLIAARLSDAQMYVNPQVQINVTVSAGQFATVSGEVHAIIPIAGSRRLLEVLAAAGTLPPTASHVITILRPGVQKPIVVDLGTDPLRSAQANVPILPRDIIIISRVGVVYMLGAFKAQGAISLAQTSPLTLIEAAALSGGPTLSGSTTISESSVQSGSSASWSKSTSRRCLRAKLPTQFFKQTISFICPPTSLRRYSGQTVSARLPASPRLCWSHSGSTGWFRSRPVTL